MCAELVGYSLDDHGVEETGDLGKTWVSEDEVAVFAKVSDHDVCREATIRKDGKLMWNNVDSFAGAAFREALRRSLSLPNCENLLLS